MNGARQTYEIRAPRDGGHRLEVQEDAIRWWRTFPPAISGSTSPSHSVNMVMEVIDTDGSMGATESTVTENISPAERQYADMNIADGSLREIEQRRVLGSQYSLQCERRMGADGG